MICFHYFFFEFCISDFPRPIYAMTRRVSISQPDPMEPSKHTELWERCLQILKDNLPPEQFDTWFSPVTSMSYVDDALTIDVPSPFFVEQIEERFFRILKATLVKVYGPKIKLFYHYDQVSHQPETGVTMRSENPNPAIGLRKAPPVPVSPFQAQQLPDIDSQLNPRYTFENYCTSASNRVAYSIGEAIAMNPKLKTFNPLFIFGPTGVGKTHLIQAIGIRIKEQNPQTRVLYITSRLFESQYTTAVKRGKINDFINFYQSIDVLIIDDIQDLMGKNATQNTFFHIFNHLHQNQKQLILSSDCRPSEMEGMEARLLSRFKWGMTTELEKPDLQLRRDVLLKKSENDGLQIPDDVLDFIAGNVTESIRDLDGIISSLIGHAAILNRPITIDLARRVVANAVKIHRRQINFEMITQQVSTFFNIDVDSIFTKSRKREVSDARQMIMFLAKKHANMPLKAIGTRLSRTHATVLYACRNIEERLPLEKSLQEAVTSIESLLLQQS